MVLILQPLNEVLTSFTELSIGLLVIETTILIELRFSVGPVDEIGCVECTLLYEVV